VLADVFGIYLDIRHTVDKQVAAALGCDTLHWGVHYTCPPCSYKVSFFVFLSVIILLPYCSKLEGETLLVFQCMLCFDRNNSLKHFAQVSD
jgi:hypothetical protein